MSNKLGASYVVKKSLKDKQFLKKITYPSGLRYDQLLVWPAPVDVVAAAVVVAAAAVAA